MPCQHTSAAVRVVTRRSREILRSLGDREWVDRIDDLEAATTRAVLPEKTALLVQIAVHSTITGIAEEQVRVYVRRALAHHASREEIAAVFKLCAVIGIHSIAQAAPILAHQMERFGVSMASDARVPPRIETMRRDGSYNNKWDQVAAWDPVWLDTFLAVGYAEEARAILGDKTWELLCIAIDATVTHLYNPGTERHVEAALALGVRPEEILEVLKIVSIQGLRSIDAGMKILDEEERLSN